MKKLLNTLLVFILLSCGAQSYLENNNLGFCTDTVIPKDKYLFDINNYKKLAETEGYKNVVVDSDTTKTLLREDISYEKQKKYYKDIKTKKNNFHTVYTYDSIGRLIEKYNDHSGTEIGEEIKFKYSDIKSTTPIETYRVNYDTIYPVCWKEALRIATKKGIKPQEVHMDIQYPLNYWDKKKPMEWTIYDYEHIMYIDAFTGKATNLRKKGSGLPTN